MMRSHLALASVALLSALSFGSAGCIVGECEGGKDNCVRSESTIQYTGNASQASASYASGRDVEIVNVNGQVDVNVGGGDAIAIEFRPFTRNTDDTEGESAATAELAEKLVLEVTEGDTIQIRVSTRDGATGFLGAHIVVTLPSSFDGDLDVDSNNGSVDVDLGGASPASTTVVTDNGGIDLAGAGGPLHVVGGNGSVTVAIADWAADGIGTIHADNGDIDLTIPADADGTLTLVGDAVVDDGVSGDKAENEGGMSFTLGEGAGAHVDVTTDFGTVTARSR